MVSPQRSQLVTQIGQLASDGLVLTVRLNGPCAARQVGPHANEVGQGDRDQPPLTR
jgi:hypothetical protein